MKIVEVEFKGRGSQKSFDFKQLKREGCFAIYQKKDRELGSVTFETVHIRKHNGYTLGGVTIPPGERYPSDREFGLYGFACMTLERAEFRLNEFLNNKNE